MRTSRKQIARRERYARLFDTVSTAAGIVGAVAEGAVAVPGLCAAAALVGQIVERAQAVVVNKRDCDDLVQKVCDYLAALAAKPPGAGAVILHLDFFEDLQVFNSELEHVLELLDMLSGRKYWMWFLQYAADRRALDDCKTRLSDAFQRLMFGHMLSTEHQLHDLRRGVHNVAGGVRLLRTTTQTQLGTLQAKLSFINRNLNDGILAVLLGLHDLESRIPRGLAFDIAAFIKLLFSGMILWDKFAIGDAIELGRVNAVFQGDVRTWVNVQLVSRLLRRWPTATRALVTGWDLRPHRHNDYTRFEFFVLVEYAERRRRRYAQIEVHAVDLEGREGRALMLEEENEELVGVEMDEQMGEAHNYMRC